MCQKSTLNGLPVKTPMDFLKDLVECTKADCCDGHSELCTGGECGDDEMHHAFCCRNRSLSSEGGLETSHNNGDLKDLPSPLIKCQNIRETLPFPEDTLRVAGNSGGWLWVVGIQARSDSNTPMRNALLILKGKILFLEFL